jgi:hypothetical protein
MFEDGASDAESAYSLDEDAWGNYTYALSIAFALAYPLLGATIARRRLNSIESKITCGTSRINTSIAPGDARYVPKSF